MSYAITLVKKLLDDFSTANGQLMMWTPAMKMINLPLGSLPSKEKLCISYVCGKTTRKQIPSQSHSCLSADFLIL